MTYLKSGIYLLFCFIFLSSCTEGENDLKSIDTTLLSLLKTTSKTGNLDFYELPASQDYLKIPQDVKNPISKEKVALGGFLFHETALGVDGIHDSFKKSYSCASCHHSAAGFQSGTFQGVGEGGIGFGRKGELRKPSSAFADVDAQPLKSPSVINVAYQKNMFWNGQFGATALNIGTESLWDNDTPLVANHLGYEGVETQAIAGLGIHRLNLDESILKMGAYKNLFDEAFPNIAPEKRYTKETVGLAIAAYLRTLLSNEAPFQKYLKGQIYALNEQEKTGALLFFGKANCVNCHNGPALNSMQFNAIGLGDLVDCPEPTLKTVQDDVANLGRGGFTKKASDNYKFKVPQLYNLKDAGFYGHGSSLRSIKAVIEYKNNGIAENNKVPYSQLDPNFKPLGLTKEEIDALEAFISNGLYDSNLKRYVPELLPSGLCFPNADVQSRIDMDCF